MNEILEKLGLLALADADPLERQKAVLERIDALNADAKKLATFLQLNELESLDAAEEKLLLLAAHEADEAVRTAFADGKLTENMRSWAHDFARNDLAAFRTWSDAAPRIVPDNKDTDEAPLPENGADTAFTPEEAKIASLLGLTEPQRKAIRKMKGTCR